MFTQEQEDYLKTLADKGIAELQEIEARNEAITLEAKIKEARDAKKAELEEQANLLIQNGLADFELNEKPKIK